VEIHGELHVCRVIDTSTNIIITSVLGRRGRTMAETTKFAVPKGTNFDHNNGTRYGSGTWKLCALPLTERNEMLAVIREQ
jgi:hypothetical protein